MARIRSIHPGLFSDPEFASLSDAAQMFYLGLLTEADDNGIFDWNPAKLRIRLRPGKDGGVEALLSELSSAQKIRSYEVGGRKHGAIRNFRKFQRPKSPKSWFVIPTDFRNYVGLSDDAAPDGGNEAPSYAPTPENPPQRKEEGGRMKEEISEPIGSGGRAPPREVIFNELLPWLSKRAGKDCRSFVGRLLAETQDDESIRTTLEMCEAANPVDPVGWIRARCKPRPDKGQEIRDAITRGLNS